MTAGTQPVAIGFLTAVENAELGLIGGYLLLNPAGRPLEFHCTAPVKASRTQQILYGPTLLPFLYGEQIGQTLINRSKLTPIVICTDCEPMLAVREFVKAPVVWLTAQGTGDRRQGTGISVEPSRVEAGFRLANNGVNTAPAFASDESAIRAAWPCQADHLDLLEPFARIREALDEAQRAARPAQAA